MDFRGVYTKHLLGDKIVDILNKEGFSGSYSLNDKQAAILTCKDNEILVERNVYEYLLKKNIVPKISWL